jgi:enamine deaminase RidA (YjgF/YER057c/UK114 family)
MSFEKKLNEMGYSIEPIPPNNGKIVPAVRTGNLIYTSGQVPTWGDKSIKGKVGQDLTLEDAIEAARICALNNLRAIKTVIGSLDNIERFVKVSGMVNVAPGFDNTSGVINGCTDFLVEVFGEAGRHARCATGMTIPFNFAVEIEMVVEVKADSGGK